MNYAQERKLVNRELLYLLLTSIELNPSIPRSISVFDTPFVTFPVVVHSDSDDSLANVNGVGIFGTKFRSFRRSWTQSRHDEVRAIKLDLFVRNVDLAQRQIVKRCGCDVSSLAPGYPFAYS
jgi:hypothetical protein